MNSRLFKIIWAPTIGSWAILWAIYVDTAKRIGPVSQAPLLVVVFMLCSAYLAYKFDRLISNSSESDSVTAVSQSYANLWTLFIAAIVSLVGTVIQQTGNYWLVAVVIATTIVSTAIEGLGSYSEEQLTSSFEARSQERTDSITAKEAYAEELSNLARAFTNDDEINHEIKRILSIISYSSFFRSARAAKDLTLLQDPNNFNRARILEILRGIA